MGKKQRKKTKRQSSYQKKRTPLRRHHDPDVAQIRGLGGILSSIVKIPQILQTIWQLAPLIRMVMGSFSRSNQAALPAPPNTSEEEMNPVTDVGNDGAGMEEKAPEDGKPAGQPNGKIASNAKRKRAARSTRLGAPKRKVR